MSSSLESSSGSGFNPTYYLIWGDSADNEQRCDLHPDQVVNIGRAPTNRVVLRDDVCSRNHCEVFHTPNGWILRDRNSRNGTSLNDEPVNSDTALGEGDLIRIGSSYLLFSSDPNCTLAQLDRSLDGDTATDLRLSAGTTELPKILHRQKQSTLRDANQAEQTIRQRAGLELSRLYQMALEMGNVNTARELSEIVLDGLVGITGADIGAVLTRPNYDSIDCNATEAVSELVNAAYRNIENQDYHPVSSSLSEQVLLTVEAVLAHDLSHHEELTQRDSIDNLQAKSLIVAPIHTDGQIFGLIHLYSTNPENVLDENDLDYTLAVADQLALALQNLHQRQELEDGLIKAQNENLQLKHQLAIETELIGDSPVMEELKSKIALVAPTDAVVLVRGESGAGKELVARAIHYNSHRKDSPFVCMNCAALNESLLESELFGHEKGAFTGATDLKHGKFEQAHQGTLFLDEVGEMSPAIQAKFLRILEGHPFERVGGSASVKADVRLVAATNKDLEEAVNEGQFRKDLYFRLQVFEIVVPPLRDRREDIPVLADFFAERFAEKTGRPVKGFSSLAMKRLSQHDWPGNVRELQNSVERAVVLSTGNMIDQDQIHISKLKNPNHQESLSNNTEEEYSAISMERLEQEHILRILEMTKGNKSKASQVLGIERSTLDRKLKKYGIKNPGK